MSKKKVEEVAEVEVIDPEKEVSVNLDENNNVVKPEVKKAEEPRYVRPEELQETIRKANAAFFAEQRKTQARLDEIASKIQSKEPSQNESPKTEWDEKVQKDWKGTVEELSVLKAREEYKRLREEEKLQEREERERLESSDLLNRNKVKVMQRHPELDDPTSEKARIFQDVISNNPSYLVNPHGPVLAMRDMEDELRSQGKFVDEPTRKIVDSELSRRARVGASAVPNGNGTQSANRIVLTKDEKQYCDDHKIKYETFASTKQKLNSQREIEA